MAIISSYRDFFVFLDRLAQTRADLWSLYCQHYLEPHQALLTAWWEQCMGLPAGTMAGKSEEVWRRRVENVRVEHYTGIRALLDSCNLEEAAAESLQRCQSLLPAPEPSVNLMVGFFSPDGFILQVEGEWQIGLGLERLGDAERIPLLVAHEYAHWYRRFSGLGEPGNLGERLIEEGLAVHLSSLAYPERSLAQHLFVSEARLSTLQEYRNSLLQAAFDKLSETDASAIQRFIFSPPTDPESPPRPGGYVGYELLSEYLRKHPKAAKTVFQHPAAALLK